VVAVSLAIDRLSQEPDQQEKEEVFHDPSDAGSIE
jgi:hypothetical protein